MNAEGAFVDGLMRGRSTNGDLCGCNCGCNNEQTLHAAHQTVPPSPSGCSTTRKGARAATLHFGRHRDKPGVGYTCSLQAMNCVSRASPDLHPSATRATKQMQPHTTAAKEQAGVRGEARNLASPGGFAPLSTHESGLLHPE